MKPDTLSPEIEARILQLAQKYEAMGQDLNAYLDGLLHANYLTYWDYVHLDTLLSLQTPRTDFPDETVFIIYHQITELYFKAIQHEIKQLAAQKNQLTGDFFLTRIERINRYLAHLTHSFEVMVDGMEVEQFLKFRMSLLPSSGFQSVQFREIEIQMTNFRQLLEPSARQMFDEEARVEEMFAYIYWKRGAIEADTQKRTLTLRQFEKKYSERLLKLARAARYQNVAHLFTYHLPKDDPERKKIQQALRQTDALMNVDWALAHYKSAVRYLRRDKEAVAATGGTNWQAYLPPKFQKIIFFPDLWTPEEQADWGKHWVEANVGIRTR
ncbi:MAG: tryptophan 2,3-dioxygenase family protein [Bernardetiaceae bacterium]